ncbi:hypothetical protein EVG20_g3203 [Dentipellis fragilis]|uniref:Uncharacterized protein n=1 Tax=Dentipellis fragilis TaxID=205917 RepID=A0A4Y9Z399_9AGAM|nr:hypothetical protein EVG20_g3203 [Dentipellis fragilis]
MSATEPNTQQPLTAEDPRSDTEQSTAQVSEQDTKPSPESEPQGTSPPPFRPRGPPKKPSSGRPRPK